MKKTVTFDIGLLRKGNRQEYEKIYREFFDFLFALGMQYLTNQNEAENVVQDAFLRLWEVRERLNEGTNVRNFLYTLVRNLCLNQLRSRQAIWKHIDWLKASETGYAIRSLSELGDHVVEFEELVGRVQQAIETLPADLRTVFSLSRHEQLKYREIADKLSISPKTVEARMTKALKLLRTELSDYITIIFLFVFIFG